LSVAFFNLQWAASSVIMQFRVLLFLTYSGQLLQWWCSLECCFFFSKQWHQNMQITIWIVTCHWPIFTLYLRYMYLVHVRFIVYQSSDTFTSHSLSNPLRFANSAYKILRSYRWYYPFHTFHIKSITYLCWYDILESVFRIRICC
jgi:hypothetical protein